MKQKLLLKTMLLLFALIAGSSSVWADDVILTLDCATPAPTGSTSTALSSASDVATFLNSAAGLSSAENKITCSAKDGDVYKGKGSGGGDIPQQCLKVGKASGGGGFTFTIPNTYDNVDIVEITCYGWKTSSSISINSRPAQTFTTAQVETTKTFELASGTKTIAIAVTTSAVCITKIVLKKKAADTPKGSIHNPYTVAEVINGTATGSNVYVRGFIVGEYVGSSTAPRTSDFSGNSNIAIADAFTSSPTAASSIPIQLGTTALQNAWGCKKSEGTLLGYEILVKGNINTYFSVNGIKETSEVTAISVLITISDYKWATFVSNQILDFTGTGVNAYVVTGASGTAITKTAVTNVAANTPLLLNAPEGTYTIPVAVSGTDYSATNKLVAGPKTVNYDDGASLNYVLSIDETSGAAMFQKIISGTYGTVDIPAGKAYLALDADPGAPVLNIDGEGRTGIKAVNVEGFTLNGPVYDLQGRRVAQPTKGLYIVNGKKLVIK